MRTSWAKREAEATVISIPGAQKNKVVSDKIEASQDLAAISKGHRKGRREIICFAKKWFSGISSK